MDEQQDGITKGNDFVEKHSSAIADAMQDHFGVPVSVSKSKTNTTQHGIA